MANGGWHQPATESGAGQMIAIASAQPNAGKSVVASNFAAALASLGQKVVLVDLDPHSPCQHTLLGGSPKPRSLDTWLEDKENTRDAIPTATRVRNLRLLPYAGSTDRDRVRWRSIIDGFPDLEADIVVVDIGPSNRDDVFDFFATRAIRLLVTPRDRPALEATYAFLRSAARRAHHRHGARAPAVLERFCGGLVGNWVAAPEEAETFHAFSRLVRAHLGIPLPVLGCLRSSERIPQSIAARQPLVSRRGVDDNVRAFQGMAEWVLAGASTRSPACDLGPGGDDLPTGPLPADLAGYARRHPRFPVDWAATLELSAGATAVRVRDVSFSGAGVETLVALRIGDHAILHLDQLDGQPAFPVVVKNVMSPLKRVGLGFLAPGQAVSRLLAAAAKVGTRA